MMPLPPAGSRYARQRTFRQREFDGFARVSGDDNPIHVDPEFSARTRFGRTVAHGMLLYGALWGLIQEHFPGARQLEQSMRFSAPTYADEPMRLELEVLECREPSELRLAVRVARASDGVVTLEGETRLVLGKGA